MSASFSVKLRANKFQEKHLVFGPIWIELDGHSFPTDNWYDFPVVILGWWLNNIKLLVTGKTRKCECLFMDGPYEFQITMQNSQMWSIKFIERRLDKDECLFERVIDPNALFLEMLSSANIIVDVCRRKGWESSDLLDLEKEIDSINSTLDKTGLKPD